MSKKQILFDVNSTSTTSAIINVGENACVQIRAYNLGPGEEVLVELVSLTPGSYPAGVINSCLPNPVASGPQVVAVMPYSPCGYQQFLLDETRNTIVIRSAGFYQFQLSLAALGTVIVEAIFYEGEESCNAIASECCCQPEIAWLGTSTNPCLTITPGGPAGHSPEFGLDACCLLQSLPANPNPQLTDRLVFLSGPDCFTATIDEVFSQAVVCDSLGEFSVQPSAAGDTFVVVDAGNACKRVDASEYLCSAVQALPSCACTPNIGDLVMIVQGGDCVLATWPATDLCDQIGLLPLGAPLPDDRVPVREAGGACKYLPLSSIALVYPILAPDGTCDDPTYSFLSDPDSGLLYEAGVPAVTLGFNNCDSFVRVGDEIRIEALNGDFIEVGASINLNATGSGSGNLTAISTNNLTVTSTAGVLDFYGFTGFNVTTAGVPRLTIHSSGSWLLPGSAGLLGQVITSQGPGTPPIWAAAGGVAFPLLGSDGSCAAPTYSFTSDPSSGMFYDAGAGSVIIGDANCTDFIEIGASINITSTVSDVTVNAGGQGNFIAAADLVLSSGATVNISGTTSITGVGGVVSFTGGSGESISLASDQFRVTTGATTRLTITPVGGWEIGGTAGVAGQAIVSNGPGGPPTWQAVSASVPLNDVLNTTGSATRTHAGQIIWNWGNPGAGTAAFQHGLASASTNAELLRLDVTEPANSNVYALRVTWTGGGEFALRTGSVTDAVLLKGADTLGQEIHINGGDGPAGVNGGGVTIEGGDGGINTGGSVTNLAGNGIQGGDFRGQGGNSAGTGFVGGDAQLIGGDSTNLAVSAAARGGDVYVRGGDCDAGGAASTTQWGNVYLNADGTFPLVSAAATSGFVYLPRVAGPPVGTPAVLPATGTFAMVVENTSPTLTLWMYDPVGGAWRSVVLV